MLAPNLPTVRLSSSRILGVTSKESNESTGRRPRVNGDEVLYRQDTYKGSPWQPWTQNLYTYVGNNPVNYVDPTGHSACTPEDKAVGNCKETDDGAETTSAYVASAKEANEPQEITLPDGTKVIAYSDGRVFKVDKDGQQEELKPTASDASGNWFLLHPCSSIMMLMGVSMAVSSGPPSVVGDGRSLARNTLAVATWKGSGVVLTIVSGRWAGEIDDAINKGIHTMNDAIIDAAESFNQYLDRVLPQ